jgi:pentatricopeptide repeat protein
LPAEVATFHDLLYEPTEKSISLRVKHLVANGNASAAEALLDYMQDMVDKKSVSSEVTAAAADGNSLKLRTYLTVLRAYCDEGNCSAVLKLFTRMKFSPGVVLEPDKLFFFSPNVRQSDVVVT